MRGGKFNWPSFTLEEERQQQQAARRMNGADNPNGFAPDFEAEVCRKPEQYQPAEPSTGDTVA